MTSKNPKPLDRQKRLNRLKSLGVQRGTRHIAMPPPKARPTEPPPNTERVDLFFLNYEDDLQHAVPIENVIAGQEIQNEHGKYFNFVARYPLNAPYGHFPLRNLLDIPMQTVARITGDDDWLDLSWQDVLFIDTETTGLEIAAGTVAFLIGIGYVEGNDFVMRQVFMRDFDEEMALLHDLHTLCERFKGVVSFNGKTFDIPLLENRFILARLFTDLFDGPHFDLLHPSRRIWRRRLENCKLSTLEAEILGLTRTQADVPGYFIPSLYRKFLVDHDARPMGGIFYHNELDIVSMASLTALICRHFQYPQALPQPATYHPLDMLSIGLWFQHLGQTDVAEQALNEALQHSLSPELHHQATAKLAYLLKRQARYEEAEALWQELATTANPLVALEELAKYYEWRTKDFAKALTCIDYALKFLADENPSWQRAEAISAWTHRRARVQGKLNVTPDA